MRLEDVIPETPEFEIKKIGKSYRLRLVTIEDHVWFRTKFGGWEKVIESIQKQQWENVAKIAFHLLEDKSDFRARTEKVIDDDGEEVEVRFTGPDLLLKSLTGLEEAVAMLGAINASIANSSPLIKEAMKTELKKNLKNLESQTGEPSSTSSLQNMDTPFVSSA